jgi:hypothetical protein
MMLKCLMIGSLVICFSTVAETPAPEEPDTPGPKVPDICWLIDPTPDYCYDSIKV